MASVTWVEGLRRFPSLWVKLFAARIPVFRDGGMGENHQVSRRDGLRCHRFAFSHPEKNFSSSLRTSLLCPQGNLESKTGFRDSESHQLPGKCPPRKLSLSFSPQGHSAGMNSLLFSHLMSAVWGALSLFPQTSLLMSQETIPDMDLAPESNPRLFRACPSYFTPPHTLSRNEK